MPIVDVDYLKLVLKEYQDAEAENMQLAAFNHGAAVAIQKLIDDATQQEVTIDQIAEALNAEVGDVNQIHG